MNKVPGRNKQFLLLVKKIIITEKNERMTTKEKKTKLW